MKNLKVCVNPYRYSKKGRHISLKFKRWLWLANDCRCRYCGENIPSHKEMAVDHIVPVSLGGSDNVINLGCSCESCNSAKGNKSLEELRFFIAVKRSPIHGIISPKQAKQLIALGIDVGVNLSAFYFEGNDERTI